MKIIQVAACFPPRLGGMEKRTKDLAERLAQKGHQIEVFTSDIGCKEGKLKSTPNFKIHYLRSFEIAHTPISPSLLFRLLKIPRNSIIHVHIAHALVPEIVCLVSKIRKIPYVAHVRTNIGPSGKLGFLLPFYKKLFLKKVLTSANKIIVLNEDYRNFVCKKYAVLKDKVKVIPNATSFPLARKIRKGLPQPIRLLFVGRLSVEKNIPLIVKAMDNLLEQGFNLNLTLVGEGPRKKQVLGLSKRLGINKKLVLKGRVEGDKLRKIYLSSDIVLLPSSVEGFSSVLLEAMASGTPIITSDIPGTRNVIKNNYNGLLVHPSPESIARAIKELIKKPKLREKIIKNGLIEVRKYSWDKIVEQTEALYQEVKNEAKKR